MKIYHLADLHFGKSIYGLSMLDDQKYWTEQFLKLCREQKPDAILIAGDVYDRSSPSGEAVALLDHLLSEIAEMSIPVLMIAGNHDSGQKLAFASSILNRQNIHIAGVAKREIEHVVFENPDGYGEVTVWLLPYTYPEQVSLLLEDEEIRSYDDAVRKLINSQPVDFTKRNIIVAHQNVTANGIEAERGGSESMVGGVGQIDYSVFDGFEYAALGHIHSAYPIGRNEVRYAGTPLCYHFAETRQQSKGPVEIILNEKGSKPEIRTIPIEPLHKMRCLMGTKDEIYSLLENDTGRGEYFGITVSDQRITPEINGYIKELLAARESLVLELISSYTAFANRAAAADRQSVENRALEDLFSDLYTEQSGGTPPSKDEYEVMQYVGEMVRNQDAHQPYNPACIDQILSFTAKIKGETE
ncbi:MAG: exonuclease SbcCD subunit D [Erysipelotrichaceae bacterium]|nr:exonuclease SbcCD subunit D [Erysipelotrichaceae bacterium]